MPKCNVCKAVFINPNRPARGRQSYRKLTEEDCPYADRHPKLKQRAENLKRMTSDPWEEEFAEKVLRRVRSLTDPGDYLGRTLNRRLRGRVTKRKFKSLVKDRPTMRMKRGGKIV